MSNPQNISEWRIVANHLGIEIPQAISKWYNLSQNKKNNFEKKFILFRSGYPLDYLLNYTEINDFKFVLNEYVLIPRTETEELITIMRNDLKHIENTPHTLLDIGCGSGFIGINLANCFDKLIMSDVSSKALEVTRNNITLNNITNCTVIASNLLNKIDTIKGNWWLVANLPYVPLIDKHNELENNTVYEPDLAIYSGESGLVLWYQLIDQVLQLPNPPQCMYFELDVRNIKEAQRYLIKTKLYKSIIKLDLSSELRFLICFL